VVMGEKMCQARRLRSFASRKDRALRMTRLWTKRQWERLGAVDIEDQERFLASFGIPVL
jgi:esterase/lipase superfamily enzyme